MVLIDGGMRGKYHVVGSTDLPPGVVYAWEPDKLARKLGLYPYFKGPSFSLRQREPQTDDMRQMLDDIGVAPATLAPSRLPAAERGPIRITITERTLAL